MRESYFVIHNRDEVYLAHLVPCLITYRLLRLFNRMHGLLFRVSEKIVWSTCPTSIPFWMRHEYAVMGGGTNEYIHDCDMHIDRHPFLYLKKESARWCTVSGTHGIHKIFYEVFGTGSRKLFMISTYF